MSDTYTKLFSSITESTVWGEPYPTRIVWVAMLAMADARGNVYGSVPGLARRANVTLQEAEQALESFRSPDAYSRTKDQDGRRIVDMDGGWHLVNHGKYGAVRDAAERRESKREWDRQNRPSGHARAKGAADSPSQSDTSPTEPAESVPTSTNTSTSTTKNEASIHTPPVAAGSEPEPDRVGQFEGHEHPPATIPNPVAAFAVALTRAGMPCTSLNPDLVAYVDEGGTVEHLVQCAGLPDAQGKKATYAIRIARRELTTDAPPIAAGTPRVFFPAQPSRQAQGVASLLGMNAHEYIADFAAGAVVRPADPGVPGHVVPLESRRLSGG